MPTDSFVTGHEVVLPGQPKVKAANSNSERAELSPHTVVSKSDYYSVPSENIIIRGRASDNFFFYGRTDRQLHHDDAC